MGITINTNLNTALNTDLRLLNNRKAIELNSLTSINEYDLRSAQIKIEWKYQVIIEALEGLYTLGIQHSCNLAYLTNNFEAIAPSCR
jgi:hypothetical protein